MSLSLFQIMCSFYMTRAFLTPKHLRKTKWFFVVLGRLL
jgi:hypothetical protein